MKLEPKGLAIRLTGLSAPLEEGGHLDMHLLTDRGEVAIEVEIGDADAPQHSHAGHAH